MDKHREPILMIKSVRSEPIKKLKSAWADFSFFMDKFIKFKKVLEIFITVLPALPLILHSPIYEAGQTCSFYRLPPPADQRD